MLWALIVLLILLWALGAGPFALGSLIHLLLVVVIVLVIVQLASGSFGGPRRPL